MHALINTQLKTPGEPSDDLQSVFFVQFSFLALCPYFIGFFGSILSFGCLMRENEPSSCYFAMAGGHGSPLSLKFQFLTIVLVFYIHKLTTENTALSHFIVSTSLMYISPKRSKTTKSDLSEVTLQSSPCLLVIFSSIKKQKFSKFGIYNINNKRLPSL